MMPVIEVYSSSASPGRQRLAELSGSVTTLLGIEPGHCWVLWNRLDQDSYYRPGWDEHPAASGPVALVVCKQTYPPALRSQLAATIARGLALCSGADERSVYVAVRPVKPGDLWVRGAIWHEPEAEHINHLEGNHDEREKPDLGGADHHAADRRRARRA